MFILGVAFLTTYLAYYLLNKLHSDEADVPTQVFLGILIQSVVVVIASIVGGKLSDRTGRRKVFVLMAAILYGGALIVIAIASSFNGFLVGMAISGIGFGIYVAVDRWPWSPMCCPTKRMLQRISAFSISPAPYRSRWHRPSPR